MFAAQGPSPVSRAASVVVRHRSAINRVRARTEPDSGKGSLPSGNGAPVPAGFDPISGQGVDDTITLTINYAPITEIKPLLKSTLDPGLAQDKLLARVTQLETENREQGRAPSRELRHRSPERERCGR